MMEKFNHSDKYTQQRLGDEFWMSYAIMLADQAEDNNEVPVGAVLVLNDKIIGEGCNSSIKLHDPTAHAEIIALRQGCTFSQNYRCFLNSVLYVTLEPCLMCTGALIHARIGRLVFGANDKKIGVIGALIKQHRNSMMITMNVLAQACSMKLRHFFLRRRIQHKL